MKSLNLPMVDLGQSWSGPAARAKRTPIAPLDVIRQSDGFFVEALGLEGIDEEQEAWADLASRALEPNAFFEPGFALSTARHFPVKARPKFIAVWSRAHGAGARRMVGLFPIVTPSPVFGDGLIRLWLHKQAALATPLLDRDDAVPALATFFDWLERQSAAAGVVFSKTPKNGPVFEAVSAAARREGRSAQLLDAYERAALYPGGDADELCTRADSKKKLNDIHRRRRRLEEMGPVDFVIWTSPDDVRRATEDFLALEAAGWKFGRGAFLSHPSLTTFVRSATRLLAREGKCQVSALRLAGRPVAMAILIESQRRSYCWKIAFDENFRSQAPGIQLAYLLTKTQLARPEIEITDSCAIANHPMIDKLWPDRVAICDFAVQLQKGRESAFLDACRKDQTRRRLRAVAKDAAVRLLKRKVN